MKKRLETVFRSIRQRRRPHEMVNGQIVLTPVQARQGLLGRPLLFVLVVGLALVVTSFGFIVWSAS